MRRIWTGITVLAAAGALTLLSAPTALAGGMNLTVGTCPGANYATIQAAVNAATPNAHITVCPGVYQEQVSVPAGLGNLVLQGQGSAATAIQYPATGETAAGPNGSDDVVALSPGAGDSYQLNNFVIEGPWTDGSNGRHFGVYVTGAGSALINHDGVRNIEDVASDPASRSTYDGFGIAIGDSSLFDDGAEVPGHAQVEQSTITNYQTLGVTVTVAGTTGTVNNDTIQGLSGGSPQDFLVGVVAADGANASVHNNTISGNYDQDAVAGNDATQGAGIFAGFAPGTVTSDNNVLTANDIGLQIQGASGVVSSNDKLVNNNFDGIHVDASDPFGDTTSGNTLSNDQASGNKGYDCEDDTAGTGTAGTADTWTGDQGVTANPAGICRH